MNYNLNINGDNIISSIIYKIYKQDVHNSIFKDCLQSNLKI